jgi:hypothetical protein
MKVELFKKLIKEAVREAVREELIVILSEDVKPVSNKPVIQHVTKYAEHRPIVAKPVPTGNPIMDLMNETKHSMTQGEYQNLVSATSDTVSAPGLGMNPMMENFRQGPEPGLDISQFDFMMRAGDVFKASVEKDKARFGG